MNRRALALAVLLAVGAVGRFQLQAIEPRSAGHLDELPLTLAQWSGERAPDFDAEVLEILRPDAHINRVYRSGDAVAGLYVGYYRSQTYGSTIHSPMNCLPGAGWQPVATERIALGDRGNIKRVVIEKGESRQLVLYWYQTLKRVEGNEYMSKFHLVADAFTTRRNDAALVRIILPLRAAGQSRADADATRVALALAANIQPQVQRLLFEAS